MAVCGPASDPTAIRDFTVPGQAEPEVCLSGIRGVVTLEQGRLRGVLVRVFPMYRKENTMAKYLGQGTMVPGTIEEDRVDSQWKTWSIGCDVHLKTVFVAVLVPNNMRRARSTARS